MSMSRSTTGRAAMSDVGNTSENHAWKAFDTSTEAGRLLKKLYGNKPPPVNVPLPRRSKKAAAPTGEWRPGGGRVDAVDPRKASRSKAAEAKVARGYRKVRGESTYAQIDFVDSRRSGAVIKSELEDMDMRQRAYRPAHQRPIGDDEKKRMAEICTYKGGRALPEEMTNPVLDYIPSERIAQAKEQKRIRDVQMRRRGMAVDDDAGGHGGGGGGRISNPTSALVQHICDEIEDRRKFLEDMEKMGQRSEHERKIAGEIRARVTELKTLDPKVAADYGVFGGGGEGGGGGAETPGKAHRPDNVTASNFLHHSSD